MGNQTKMNKEDYFNKQLRSLEIQKNKIRKIYKINKFLLKIIIIKLSNKFKMVLRHKNQKKSHFKQIKSKINKKKKNQDMGYMMKKNKVDNFNWP